MNKYLLIFLFISLSVLLPDNPGITKNNVKKDVLVRNNTGREDICNVIKKSIKEGLDAKRLSAPISRPAGMSVMFSVAQLTVFEPAIIRS